MISHYQWLSSLKEAGLSEEYSSDANYSGDNARLPMQWTREPGLGFSDGPAWLISPKQIIPSNVEDRKGSRFYFELTVSGNHPLWKPASRFGI